MTAYSRLMEANSFEYFHAVARKGSIARAAAELGMESSTLTRHISRLEQDAGIRLFHRSGRGMVLTQLGTQLLKEATRVVDLLRHTRRVAADLAAEGPSEIVLAAQPTIAQISFGAIARGLRERFPSARIRMIEGFGHELVGWLQDGKVDFALLYDPGHTPIVEYELLLQEPLHCVLPAGYVAPPGSIGTCAVLELPLVLPSTPQGLRGLAESWARQHGKRVDIAIECDGSTLMLRRLVQAGLGCTLLPLASVHSDVRQGLLQSVRVEGSEALRAVALATARNRAPLTCSWEITRLLKKSISDLVEAGKWPGVDGLIG